MKMLEQGLVEFSYDWEGYYGGSESMRGCLPVSFFEMMRQVFETGHKDVKGLLSDLIPDEYYLGEVAGKHSEVYTDFEWEIASSIKKVRPIDNEDEIGVYVSERMPDHAYQLSSSVIGVYEVFEKLENNFYSLYKEDMDEVGIKDLFEYKDVVKFNEYVENERKNYINQDVIKITLSNVNNKPEAIEKLKELLNNGKWSVESIG